jgi:phosphatidylserine decarboxylase
MTKKQEKTLSISAITFLVIALAFVMYFNRAPERTIPQGAVIVSPATGDVIHIEKANTQEISFLKKGIQNTLTVQGIEPPYNIVVIEMDPTDVHVQRAPIEGEIIYQEHIPGAHKNALWSANVEELANENEKNLIVIENEDISVGVIQVAGIMARRIESFVSPSDTLEKGQIYGRIKLGSQVVVILPESIKPQTSPGDTLIDGESIIGVY